MNKIKGKGKTRHTIMSAPCSAYDVEGMESWLSDMAARGLMLEKGGFFMGFALFEKGVAKKAEYRLNAAPKGTGIMSDNSGMPDGEAIAISEEYGWEYVASRGKFHIYRTFDPSARELNTDPAVQALSLDAIRRDERTSLISSIVIALFYAAAYLWGGWLLAMLNLGTWFMLYIFALSLWTLVRGVVRLQRLGDLRRRLLAGGALRRDVPWEKTALRYRLSRVFTVLPYILCAAMLISIWTGKIEKKDETPLGEYAAELPFATLADLAPGGEYEMRDGLSFTNTVRTWSDPLAATAMEYREDATVAFRDGRIFSGGLDIDYYKTASPFLAREAAREMRLYDKKQNRKYFRDMDIDPSSLDADSAYAYSALFPTVVIQKGTTVIRAMLYQTSPNYEMPMEEWAEIIAKSIQ